MLSEKLDKSPKTRIMTEQKFYVLSLTAAGLPLACDSCFCLPPEPLPALSGCLKVEFGKRIVPRCFSSNFKNIGVLRNHLNFDPGFWNLKNQITYQSLMGKDENIFVPLSFLKRIAGML